MPEVGTGIEQSPSVSEQSQGEEFTMALGQVCPVMSMHIRFATLLPLS